VKIGDRIRLARLNAKKSQAEIADLIGVKQATISSWEKNRTEPPYETLSKIAAALNVTPGELLGSMGPEEFGSPEDNSEIVQIPIHHARLSAGNGAINHVDAVKSFLAVERSLIKNELGVNPARLHLAHVRGDSMEPDLHEGDYVFIDKEDRYEIRKGYYALYYGGYDFVKRLQRLVDGSLNIISTNQVYPPIRVTTDTRPEEFRIIGRVVGLIHLKKV